MNHLTLSPFLADGRRPIVSAFRGMPTSIPNTHDNFPQTFSYHAGENNNNNNIGTGAGAIQHSERERGVGLGKMGRRGGFRGKECCASLFYGIPFLRIFSSPLSLLQESRIYPHLLRSCLFTSFLDSLIWSFFFFEISHSLMSLWLIPFLKQLFLHPIDSPSPLKCVLLRSWSLECDDSEVFQILIIVLRFEWVMCTVWCIPMIPISFS